MLVLSRKLDERILIGDNVIITVIRISSDTVRIGIDAPRHINIAREELLDFIDLDLLTQKIRKSSTNVSRLTGPTTS